MCISKEENIPGLRGDQYRSPEYEILPNVFRKQQEVIVSRDEQAAGQQ